MQTSEAVEVRPLKNGDITAQVKKKAAIRIDLPKSIASAVIQERMNDIQSILSGEGISDPTMKECSKCKKEGRPSYHPVENFSTIKATGKLCSQCKKCKSVSATAWCKSKAKERAEYHKNYRATRNTSISSAVKKLRKAQQVPVTEINYPEHIKGRKHLEILYAAFGSNEETSTATA